MKLCWNCSEKISKKELRCPLCGCVQINDGNRNDKKEITDMKENKNKDFR